MTEHIVTGAEDLSAQSVVYPGVLFGRFMLPDMSEHACQVGEITPDGAIFLTTAVPAKDAKIVAYLDELGRVEGVCGEAVPGGFRIAFAHNGKRRQRFVSRLAARSGKTRAAGADLRRAPRYVPSDTQFHITLPDGRTYACEIVDISLSGAAVRVDVMPSLGTCVMLGKMRGRVVRYVDAGIAIEFLKPLNANQLSIQAS